MLYTKLGIPMSTAVDMFLNQVVLVGGIPFSVTVPKPPADVDVSQMTESQLHVKLQRGYDDYQEITVELYRYDGENCLAFGDGKTVSKVPRRKVVNLIEEVNSIILN